jgi:uncharacterized membrane protein
MKTTRLEAFSDGVIAIIITIMVLELKVPHEVGFQALVEMWPVFFCYALSFVTVAIYWVNHHHLLHLVRRVDAGLLWTNMNFLFWLSLMPFATAYLGEYHVVPFAVALYGVVTTACGIAYYFLRHAVACQARDDPKLWALHQRMITKNRIATVIHLSAIPLAYFSTKLALVVFMLPAVMYFVPDRKVEELVAGAE